MTDTVLNTFVETLFGYTTDASVSTVLSNPQYYSSETPIFLKMETLDSKQTKIEQETILLSHCEDVLTHGVGFFMKLHCPLFLMWLKDCYYRCSLDYVKMSPKFRNVLRNLQEKNGVDISYIQTLVLRFAVLSFQCPSFFIQSGEEVDEDDDDEKKLDELTAESVILLYEASSNTNQFLSALLECLEKESQADFEKVILNVLTHFKKKVSSKKEFNSVNENTFNSLCMFINTEKHIPKIVGQQLSVQHKNLLSEQKKSFAVALVADTLLGNILWFTPLDAIHFLHDPNRSCRQQYFNLNVCQNARHLTKSIDNVRENVLQIVDTAHIFVTLLCRNGARYECLDFISSIAKGNQKRVQQGISSQLEFFSTMSVSMEAFALQYHGFTDSGFNFNLFWMCLKLLEPIKLHKTSSIQIEYLLSEEAERLLQPYLSESRLCFLEELLEMELSFRASPENTKTPKFSTQIFFVTFLCLHYLFRPLLNEFSHLRELLHTRQSEMASPKHSTPRQKSYHELLGEYMCFQSLIGHPMFLKSWWYFVDLTITWLSKQFNITSFTMANNNKICESREEKENLNQSSTPSHSNLSKILPYCILEDIAESIRFFLSLPSTPSFPSDPIVPAMVKSLSLINEQKLAEFFLFIFRSDDIIRNPHCRWSCGYEPFSELHGHFYFGVRVDNMELVIQHLIPTLVKAFIDAQKDGYYVRLRRRLSFTVHLGRLLELKAFIDSLKLFVTNSQTKETFIKFMAMLVESMTWLLEEGMSALAEVKKREKSQASTSSQEALETNEPLPSTTTAPSNDEQSSSNANDEFDTQGIDQGHNVSEIPFQQLERLCKSLTDAGLRTIQVVATIAKIFGDIIVDSPILLLQVTTSLNCCLEHLIGPRCLELKVSCFEKYNFDPKALLATTIMIYISLYSFDTDSKKKIIHSICNDTRYFKKTVFKKAFYIASREELLSSKHLETFSEIILLLEEASDILNAEEKWLEEIWDEIPEEYKDPIMDNLMEDPVKLPTSGHIMDRKTIERHLMTEEFDPYNRMALKFTDLIPQDELRLQIKEFVKKKKKSLFLSET